MQLKHIFMAAILLAGGYSIANEPLRPDSQGIVKEIFNPKNNKASYNQWRSSKIGGGGYILSVTISPSNPDTAYAFSDVGGIFRTDNSGRTWRMVHHTMKPQSLDCVRDLIIDPQNPDIIIAAVGTQWAKQQGIYKSTDGGKSWKKTLACQAFGNGPNRSLGSILQRSPKDKNIIYAAPGLDGVFKSEDGGDTWKNLGHGKLYIYDFKIDRDNPDTMYLCASKKKLSYRKDWGKGTKVELNGGFFRSDDAGKSWKKLSDEAPWEMVQSPLDSKRWYGIFDAWYVRYTEDKGKSWTDDSAGLTLATKKPKSSSNNSYKAIVAGPDFLVLGSGAGTFYIKKPLNSKWRKIEHKKIQGEWYAKSAPGKWDHFGRACSSIVIDPTNPKHWYFTDWYSIYQTWDSGKHWTLTIDGVENTVIHCVTQTPGNNALVHMGMADNGYFRSTDGAASFVIGVGTSNNCKAVAVAPSSTSTVYALGTKKFGWYSNWLFTSLDSGKTFSRSPMKNIKNIDKLRINSICVDFKNPKKVYIGVSSKIEPGKGGVWVSEDRGGSWKWDSKGLPQGSKFFEDSIWGSGYQLARNPNGAMVAIKGNAAYTRNSDNEEWKKSELSTKSGGSRFMQVFSSPDEEGVFYIAEKHNGLLKSEDNGKTWKKILNNGIIIATIDQDNSKRIAVALDKARGLMMSEDGGATWKEIDGSVPQRMRLKMAFAGDRLVVGTPGNGVLYLPLNESAKAEIQDKTPVATKEKKNIAKYGSCENGTKGWYKWAGKGKIKLESETGIKEGKGVKIVAEGDVVKGTVSLPFKPKGKISITGFIRNNLEKDAKAALQFFDKKGKQVGWQDILIFKNNNEITEFSKRVNIPEKAYKVNLTFVISAPGELSVDEIKITPMQAVFEK